MELLYYLGLLVLLFLIIYKLILPKESQFKNLPPGPYGLPLIGSLAALKKPLHLTLSNLSNKYGSILFLYLGSRKMLAVSTPSAIEECFTKNDIIFANRPPFPSRKILDYNFTGLGTAPYGHHWRSLRRLTTLEIFSATRIQMSSSIRSEEIRFLSKQLVRKSFLGGEKVKIKSFLYILTFNILMKMLAGKRYFDEGEAGTDKGEGKLHDLRQIFSPSIQAVAAGDFFPFLRWLPFKGMEKKLLELHRKRDKFAVDLINSCRKNGKLSAESTDGKKRTIINSLLSLQETEPEFCTDVTIKGIIMVMMIAGTDTSARTMETAVSQLLSNPEVLNKARDEIDANIGLSRLVDDADLAKLPYVYCIINEALRFGNTVLIMPPRESSEECTVGGYNIPKGTMLTVNVWALHRDPNLWVDPSKFMPERFQDTGGEKGGFRFIPFGSGRRQCPGAGLAMRLMSLTLATLIQCFDWEKGGKDCNLQEKEEDSPLEVVFRPRQSLVAALSQL